MSETQNNDPIDPADGDEPLDPRERAMHGLLHTYYEIEVGRSCPPLSELWRHVEEPRGFSPRRLAVASGVSPDEEPRGFSPRGPSVASGRVAWACTHARADLEAHLQTCPRCRKHLDLLRRELRETPWQPHSRSIRSIIPFITGGLAIAACVTALFILYAQKQPSQPDRFSRDLALIFDAVKHLEHSQLRGEEGKTTIPIEGYPPWLQNLVTDSEALEILSQRGRCEFTLQSAYSNGQLELHDGRLRLAPQIDASSEEGQSLMHAITQDNEICDQIVDVLLRHLPGASETNRADLRKALDRWRAENVLGK